MQDDQDNGEFPVSDNPELSLIHISEPTRP